MNRILRAANNDLESGMDELKRNMDELKRNMDTLEHTWKENSTSSSPFEVPSVEYLLAENAKMKSALERAVYELNNLEHRNDVLERKNKNLKKAMSLLLSNDDE